MNAFMGARQGDTEEIAMLSWGFTRFFTKVTEIPRPADLWVLLDEDERSIDDGFFVPDPRGKIWMDFPAISPHRHNYSYALNFADGHSELWRHRDPSTFQVSTNKTEQPGNKDLERLASSTSTLLRR